MKSAFKLLFAALLVAWAISRPTPARAQSSGHWVCNSAPMSGCVQNINTTISQCIANCPTQGQEEQYTYNFTECQGATCPPGTKGPCISCSTSPVTATYPSSGVTCTQDCQAQEVSMMNSCLDSNCTWVN